MSHASVQETDFTADRVDAFNVSDRPQNHGSLRPLVPEPESQPEPALSSSSPQDDASAPPPPSPSPRMARLLAPDLLRGLLMVLQSIDHASVSAGAWRHGQGLESESDSRPITAWNDNIAWTARSLTHLCAPGFMFLLGFGVVMFGQSRAKLGWRASSMAWHFFVRALVLFLLCTVLGWLLTGFKAYFLNMVLLALAVDYLLAGLFWMLLTTSEVALTSFLDPYLSPKMTAEETTPLLSSDGAASGPSGSRAAKVSFHVHNVLVAVISGVTIAWNVWMSPTHGHCQIADKSVAPPAFEASPSGYGWGFDIWWYEVSDSAHGIYSGFPPLAWISFAFLGILYARIYTARPWKPYAIGVFNAVATVLFAALFVATRLSQAGNLSEGCLKTPDQIAHPNVNPYLASFKSFFYVVKYPPSIGFMGYTMAINFFFLTLFSIVPAKVTTRIPGLLVFGKCALFFYVSHFVVFNVIGQLDKLWFGKKLGYTDKFSGMPAYGTGNIPQFWISWAIGICIMYPLCYYYGNFKAKKAADSLWRFF